MPASTSQGKTVEIQPMSVNIQVMTVNNKQMTLSVFRQLPERSFVDSEGNLVGSLWGRINYEWGDYKGGFHVVFEHDGILYRDWIQKGFRRWDGGQWMRNYERIIDATIRDLEKPLTTTVELLCIMYAKERRQMFSDRPDEILKWKDFNPSSFLQATSKFSVVRRYEERKPLAFYQGDRELFTVNTFLSSRFETTENGGLKLNYSHLHKIINLIDAKRWTSERGHEMVTISYLADDGQRKEDDLSAEAIYQANEELQKYESLNIDELVTECRRRIDHIFNLCEKLNVITDTINDLPQLFIAV